MYIFTGKRMMSSDTTITTKTGILKRSKRLRHAPPGTSPGAINIPDDALKPVINTFMFDENVFEEKKLFDVKSIRDQVDSNPSKIHWIDIRGFGDKLFFEQLADSFGIHKLQMEDVINIYQRPKADEYHGHLFLISRAMHEVQGVLRNDQLSLFLGNNFVITIQDSYEDLLDPVRERIRNGKGYLRKLGADYLAYAIMDTLLDNFFPLLEKTGERLDELEEALIENPTRESMSGILRIKRDLILMRRAIWAERDKINDILRSAFPMITDNTKIYFKDSYDHCVQILDLVESYREVTASLMDVYMSSVSNRLNQVMKVLTIISTIFIPLTFIVGLYGMNFAHINPDTGQHMPMNMPELYSPYGYLVVCLVMVIVVIAQVIFYYRKGWLG
jgi:magnesium transporter